MAAEEEPDRLLFYGDVIFRYEAFDLERLKLSGEPPDQRGGMLRGGFMQTLSSIAVRRDAILSVGNYEARWRVPHDMHCHAKLALAYDRPFRRIRQPLVRYNIATDNVMQAYQN